TAPSRSSSTSCTGRPDLGVFKSVRDLHKQAKGIDRSMPPVGDQMAAAQARMAGANQMMAAQTRAANAAATAAEGTAGAAAGRCRSLAGNHCRPRCVQASVMFSAARTRRPAGGPRGGHHRGLLPGRPRAWARALGGGTAVAAGILIAVLGSTGAAA